MKIFKKEKQVVELALRHSEKTHAALEIMTVSLQAYFAEGDGQIAEAARQVNSIETEADSILREIRDLLYSGAYLPNIRGDIYKLLSAVDRVTNSTEECLEFVSCQRPANTQSFANELSEILQLTEECSEQLRLAMRAFFKPKGKFDDMRKHARNVGKLESEIDDIHRSLVIRIFESDLGLAEKHHLDRLLEKLERISDRLENTADELQLVSLKSIV